MSISKSSQPLAPTRQRSKRTLLRSTSGWSSEEDSLLLSLLSSKKEIAWEEVKSHFPTKTIQQLTDRWNKVLNPNLVKGAWTAEEDQLIINWVTENGPKNWSSLASTLHGRLGKQCRERWVNSLDPNVDHKPWTKEEDDILIKQHELWGNKWAKIALLLKGRTDNSVKNRWNSSLKRKLERMQKGENPVQKRGRKPKRPSAPFAIEEIPKPEITEIGITLPNVLHPPAPISPTSSESVPTPELPTPILPSTNFSPIGLSPMLLSPNFLKSPSGIMTPISLKSPAVHNLSPFVPFILDPPDSNDTHVPPDF